MILPPKGRNDYRGYTVFDHISSALFDLHWLPVKYRVHFKVLLLIYKCQSGEGPVYLRNTP